MGSFSYGFDMVGNVPYQNHMNSIDGPYMSHTTQFGKGATKLAENPNFSGKWQLCY